MTELESALAAQVAILDSLERQLAALAGSVGAAPPVGVAPVVEEQAGDARAVAAPPEHSGDAPERAGADESARDWPSQRAAERSPDVGSSKQAATDSGERNVNEVKRGGETNPWAAPLRVGSARRAPARDEGSAAAAEARSPWAGGRLVLGGRRRAVRPEPAPEQRSPTPTREAPVELHRSAPVTTEPLASNSPRRAAEASTLEVPRRVARELAEPLPVSSRAARSAAALDTAARPSRPADEPLRTTERAAAFDLPPPLRAHAGAETPFGSHGDALGSSEHLGFQPAVSGRLDPEPDLDDELDALDQLEERLADVLERALFEQGVEP